MAIAVLIVGIGLAIWLSFSDVSRWVLWLIPVAVAVPWIVSWAGERDELNTQPGLLIFGGLVSVLLVCATLLLAALLRRRGQHDA